MSWSLSFSLLRDARALAVGVSLAAHAAVAAAGYAYVSWPRSVAVTVIPVEIVAAPAGPRSGANPRKGAESASQQPRSDEGPPSQPVDTAAAPPEIDTAALEHGQAPDQSAALPVPPPPTRSLDEPIEAIAPTPHDFVAEIEATPNPIDLPVAFVRPRSEHKIKSPANKAPENLAIAPQVPEPALESYMPVVASVPLSSWRVSTPTKPATIVPAWSLPTSEAREGLEDEAVPARVALAIVSPTPDVTPPRRAKIAPPLPKARPPRAVAALTTIQPRPPANSERTVARHSNPLAPVPIARPAPQRPFEPNTAPVATLSPPPPTSSNRIADPPPRPSAFSALAKSASPQTSSVGAQSAHLSAAITEPAAPGGGSGGLGTDLHPVPGNPAPRYPRLARERGWQGRVVLEVAVTNQGTVDRAEVDRSSGYRALDIAALQAVRRWRFAFAVKTPVRGAVVRVPIIFKLRDE